MTAQHSTTPPAPDKEPPVYLVGKIGQPLDWLKCCPTASSWLCREKATERDVVIAIPCRRWGCAWCGQRMAFRLAIKCELAKPDRLITLTIDPKRWITPRDAYDGTRRQVADFAKLLRKQLGKFEYFRVLEVTKKGWPHYHFLARCPFIRQDAISRIWATMTGAPIVDIRRIGDDKNVFKYVLKYLCKQKSIPWTNRRTAWSRSFFPPTEKHDPRDNPYWRGTRDKRHPADVLPALYHDRQIALLRPGVCVIIGSEFDPEPNKRRSSHKSLLLCQKNDQQRPS